MDFRSSRAFNLALLVKQWWRLVHDVDFLFSGTFKYFPRCQPVNAKMSSYQSATWSGIKASKWIIDQGTFWRIGDGINVKVRGDRWIPNAPDHLINS